MRITTTVYADLLSVVHTIGGVEGAFYREDTTGGGIVPLWVFIADGNTVVFMNSLLLT